MRKYKLLIYFILIVGIITQLVMAIIENRLKNTEQAIYELMWAIIWILLIK